MSMTTNLVINTNNNMRLERKRQVKQLHITDKKQ